MKRSIIRAIAVVVLWLSAGAVPFRGQGSQPAKGTGTPAQETATGRGVGLFKQRRYAEAKQVLAKAVEADPKDALARAYLGMTLYNFDRDTDGAMALLEEAVRLEPGRSQFHQWLGDTYGGKAGSSGIFKGPYYAKKCREEFEKGVELDPKDPDARESLMQYYLQAPAIVGGSVDKAREEAAALAKLDACRGLVAEAEIAIRDKDPRRAESLYHQAMEAAPDKGLPYNALAYFLLNNKRTDEAVATFRLYVKAAPSDPNAHDSLAEGLLAQGHVDESLAEYEKALQIDPYFSPSCLGLARCFEREGDWRQAREAYRRYLELVPKGHNADEARQKISELEKKS